MRTSSSLIAEANAFLDSLQSPLTLSDVAKNIEALSELKDSMLAAGFGARFMTTSVVLAEDSEGEGSADVGRQLRMLREFSNMKRYALNRVRVALAAHNILHNMMKRGTVYPVADHLPYNGSYLLGLVGLGEPAVRAYAALQREVSAASDEQMEGFAVSVKHCGGRARLNLSSTQHLEERVRQCYGDDAVVTSIKKQSIAHPLVRKQSVRIALSVGYALLAARNAKSTQQPEGRLDERRQDETNTEGYREYADILAKHGLDPDTRIDMFEGHERLKDLLLSKGLIESVEEPTALNPEVSKSIKTKRSKLCSAVVEEARRSFAFDVFRFFLTEPRRARSSYPLFQGISAALGKQYAFLSMLQPMLGSDPMHLLDGKLELEKITNIRGDLLGAAYLHLSGRSIEWCASKLGIDASEIEKTVKELEPYLKADSTGSSRSKEFLELVKGT